MEVYKIKDYTVSPTDALFFDTNVWLYIYGPLAGNRQRKQQAYSSLLSDAISRNASIFISSLVLSEYINRVLRIGFDEWKRINHIPQADFKVQYRVTQDYKDTLDDAISQVNSILQIKQLVRTPDNFNSIDINSVIDMMSQNCDYNDAYLIKLCQRDSSIKFVSDDKDIPNVNTNLKIITE